MKTPSTPAATAALDSTGMNSGCPPLVALPSSSPWEEEGSCTEWVASNTTGANFRMIASEADKDLVLDISAGKSSCTATRISRVSSNEIHFKTTSGGEVGTEFGLISQVTLRHKDQRT